MNTQKPNVETKKTKETKQRQHLNQKNPCKQQTNQKQQSAEKNVWPGAPLHVGLWFLWFFDVGVHKHSQPASQGSQPATEQATRPYLMHQLLELKRPHI